MAPITCFKEQADNKAYAVNKSQGVIDRHTAAIDALGTEIAQLDQEAVDHKADIAAEQATANQTQVVRETTLAQYTVERKNLTEGLGSARGSAPGTSVDGGYT